MDGELLTVIVVVATALAFDFTNGFHDTTNVVATSISTRVMAPRLAVGYAALLNFAGAFISLEVAATVARELVEPGSISLLVVFGGLVGAIALNLVTWYLGLPSSSSHALIGGLVGATLVAEGPDSIFFGDGIVGQVIIPALVAPGLAFALAGVSIVVLYAIVARSRPGPVARVFRGGQVVSGGLLALAHGTNDAQKTMGVIALALVAYGSLPAGDPTPPFWVIGSAAIAIGLGTYAGGWRIVRTMGGRIHKLDPAQGFAAQGTGAGVIIASSFGGFPISTTQTISGAVIGAGATRRLSAVRWGVAGNILAAWLLTLPAAAGAGALGYGITRIFGTGAAGPVIMSVAIVAGSGYLFAKRARQGVRTQAALTD
jgi:inorganic phosphate transporter, PiT family